MCVKCCHPNYTQPCHCAGHWLITQTREETESSIPESSIPELMALQSVLFTLELTTPVSPIFKYWITTGVHTVHNVSLWPLSLETMCATTAQFTSLLHFSFSVDPSPFDLAISMKPSAAVDAWSRYSQLLESWAQIHPFPRLPSLRYFVRAMGGEGDGGMITDFSFFLL